MSKEPHLQCLKYRNLCNIINVFTVTFDQFIAFLLNLRISWDMKQECWRKTEWDQIPLDDYMTWAEGKSGVWLQMPVWSVLWPGAPYICKVFGSWERAPVNIRVAQRKPQQQRLRILLLLA